MVEATSSGISPHLGQPSCALLSPPHTHSPSPHFMSGARPCKASMGGKEECSGMCSPHTEVRTSLNLGHSQRKCALSSRGAPHQGQVPSTNAFMCFMIEAVTMPPDMHLWRMTLSGSG
eukprot:5604258-Alexandrium_andersonii.AAC.1